MRTTGVFMIATLLVVVAASAIGAEEAEPIRLSGHYRWEAQAAGGDLEAVFTPIEDGAWEVAFRFDWDGTTRVFSGTADGSLTRGRLRGEVRDERDTRHFTFRGTIKEGRFRGTHFEDGGGARRRTGTLSLEVVDQEMPS